MKTYFNIIFITLFSGIVLIFPGCRGDTSEQYGQKISNRGFTEIKDVLTEPEKFSGKEIKIKGKIESECMSGCWFNVEGNGGAIHVDIRPSGLAIPQKVGSEVIVEGKLFLRDGQITLVGKGVEIK